MLRNIIIAILLACLLIIALLYALSASNNHKGVEKNVVYTLMEMSSDVTNIYKQPQEAPFAITQYMPLGYLITHTANVLIGTGLEDGYLRFYKVSRLVSFVYWLIYGGLLYLLLKRFNPSAALFNVSIVVIALVLPAIWLLNVRPDTLLLLFNLCVVYFVIKGLDAEAESNSKFKMDFILAGVFAALALFAKQDGLFVGALTGLFLLLQGKFKTILWFVMGGLATVAVMFGIMAGLFDLTLWQDNMQKGVSNGFHLFNFKDFIIGLLKQYYAFVFALTCLFGVYYLFVTPFKQVWKSRFSYLVFLLLGFTFFYSVSSFKNGSSVNYLFSPLLISFLVAGYVYGKKFAGQASDKLANGITIGFTVIAFLFIAKFFATDARFQYQAASTGVDWEASDKVVAKMEALRQADENFRYYSATGFVILTMPDVTMFPHSDITRHNDINAFPKALEAIQSGELTYIITPKRLPDEELRVMSGIELNDYFNFEEEIDGYNFYCHKLHCPGLSY